MLKGRSLYLNSLMRLLILLSVTPDKKRPTYSIDLSSRKEQMKTSRLSSWCPSRDHSTRVWVAWSRRRCRLRQKERGMRMSLTILEYKRMMRNPSGLSSSRAITKRSLSHFLEACLRSWMDRRPWMNCNKKGKGAPRCSGSTRSQSLSHGVHRPPRK